MQIKVGLCGVLLLLATATAYGLGMQSGQADSPVPTSPGHAASSTTAAPTDEQIRAGVARIGLDPDSEKGRLMGQWLTRYVKDPEYRAGLSGTFHRSGPFGDAHLSPENRLKMLRLMKDMVSGSRNDCQVVQEKRSDFVAIAKAISPQGLQDLMEMIDIAIKHEAAQTSMDERYSVAELLQVDARLDATPIPASLKKAGKSDPCTLAAFAFETIDALPEPDRQRATYEIFRLLDGKPASAMVLGDPPAYLDDVFDERRLPEPIRSHLPPDGSRPFPYSRMIVDGEWVNKTTPRDSVSFKDVFVNRRNNGVIAELLTSPDKSGKTNWSDFTLSYRVAELLSQTVKDRTHVTMLAALKDDAAITVADQPMAEGKRVDFPLPQPLDDGRTSRRCEVGQTVPASTIFGSLTGTAVDLHCSEVVKGGTTIRIRSAWLPDYGIVVGRSIEDEDGRTDVVIRNVTIVKP